LHLHCMTVRLSVASGEEFVITKCFSRGVFLIDDVSRQDVRW